MAIDGYDDDDSNDEEDSEDDVTDGEEQDLSPETTTATAASNKNTTTASVKPSSAPPLYRPHPVTNASSGSHSPAPETEIVSRGVQNGRVDAGRDGRTFLARPNSQRRQWE